MEQQIFLTVPEAAKILRLKLSTAFIVNRMSNNQYVMPDITAVSPGAVPVITMLCRTAKIGEIINQMVHWNESNSKISPCLLIESLDFIEVLNVKFAQSVLIRLRPAAILRFFLIMSKITIIQGKRIQVSCI